MPSSKVACSIILKWYWVDTSLDDHQVDVGVEMSRWMR